MNLSHDQPKDDVHHIAYLLPWYVGGTLSSEDRRTVDAHLAQCPACQEELREVQETKKGVQAFFEALPGPSHHTWENIQAEITQRVPPKAVPIGHVKWSHRLEHMLRALFAPRWAPGLAVTLIVAQTFLILVGQFTSSPEGQRTTQPITGPFIERDPAMTSMPQPHSATIQLVFQAQATEEDIRSIVHQLQGRIVDGPSLNGIYTLEIPTTDVRQLDRQLHELQETKPVIQAAQRVSS